MAQNTAPKIESRESAPFNMAIATLMRLDEVLREIYQLNTKFHMLTDEQRQYLKVDLVKSFYINSCALLTPDVIKQFDYVNDINPLQTEQFVNPNYDGSRFSGKTYTFSTQLDHKLNKVLIEIIIKLQKERYFMPPKNDARSGWSQER